MNDRDVLFRPATADDRPAILKVIRDAFRRDDEAKLVEHLWTDDAMAVEIVAIQDADLLGYCGFSAVTATPAIDAKLLGLAPLAVANEHQGRGIGKTLAMLGLKRCREQDAALVVVLGEPEYYSRFGFKPAHEYNMRWNGGDFGDAFQAVFFREPHEYETRVIRYHEAFGAYDE